MIRLWHDSYLLQGIVKEVILIRYLCVLYGGRRKIEGQFAKGKDQIERRK